ncbi:hypothetical protein BX600DRAFT_518279 [Xylariales sp. PMI_506]|nr:hypothetical protein BX600DRAFT_518279 [Xylariales sp. PMI_506]
MNVLLFLTLLGLHASSIAAYLMNPPTTADPNTVPDCSYWVVAEVRESCASIAAAWSISLSDFEYLYNPSVGPGCYLVSGQSYCVQRNYGAPSGAPVATPTYACNRFYLAEPGDTCASIAALEGIPIGSFYAWNIGVGSNCQSLWAGTYYCVGVSGQPTTPVVPGNGIVTPMPIQPGMTPYCDRFYLVAPSDGCGGITNRFGISLGQFYQWNPAVGTNCQAMWANTYVCVHAYA